MRASEMPRVSASGRIPEPSRPSRPRAFRFARAFAALTLFALAGSSVYAQSSSHERVGVRLFPSCELTVSAGLDTASVLTSRGRGLSLAASLCADLLFAGTWNLSATVPVSALAVFGGESRFPLIGASGDPEISAGFSSRIGGWRLGVDLSWTHPLGISDAAHSEALDFSSGSGAGTLSLVARANRFLDPLSFGASLAAMDTLPRASGTGAAAGAIRVKASLSVMEALNRNALLGVSLVQSLSSGTGASGRIDGMGLKYAATAVASLTLTDGTHSFRAGGSVNLANPSSPGSVQLIVSRSLNIGR
jgi:hypothetical protein